MGTLILNKQNSSFFIKMFNDMLERKGSLQTFCVYSGKGREYSLLKDVFKREKLYLPVVKSDPCFIHPNKITTSWRESNSKEGISMSISGGSFLYIPYNTKIKYHSEKMEWKEPKSTST